MYNRQNPSEKYKAHLADYIKMHSEGYERDKGGQKTKVEAKDAYPGEQLLNFRVILKQLIEHTNAKTVFDYGCGKGQQYQDMPIADSDGKIAANSIKEYWGVDKITLYDPAVESHNTLPKGKFDAVLSTDVLEHITVEDIPWVVAEQFSYAKKFVFANIACYPALATLPDGSNAHTTIRSPEWWNGLFYGLSNQTENDVKYLIVCAYIKKTDDGRQTMDQAIYSNIEGL